MTAATAEPTAPPVGFEGIPIMEQHSHLLGMLRLYAPATPPSEWKLHPWRLTTDNGYDGKASPGLSYDLKPEFAFEAFHHVALVQYNTHWHA